MNLSFSQKFLRGEGHYAIWGTAAKGIGFLNTIITLSALTLYQYGVFQLLLSLYGLASYFTSIGDGVVNNDITHYIKEKKEGHAKKLFFQYNLLRVIISVILWALFFFGASLFSEKYTSEFVNELRIISFLFLSEIFFTATESLIVAREKFAIAARRPLIAKFTQLLVLVGLYFYNGIGLREILISMIVGSAISVLTLAPIFFAIHNKWKGSLYPSENILKRIFLTYGKWDLYRQFVSQIVSRMQPWLIKFFVGTEAVAIFSLASALINGLKDFAFPAKTLKTLVPLSLDDPQKTQKIFINSMRYIFILSIAISILALIFAPIIVNNLLPQYKLSLPLFYIMLLGVPFSALGIITGVFIIALRKQKFLFSHAFLKGVFISLFYVILLPIFGLWALALERIATPLIMFFVTYFYIVKIRPGINIDLKSLFKFTREDREFFRIMYKDFRSVLSKR